MPNSPQPSSDATISDLCRCLGLDPQRPPLHVNERQAAQVLGTTPGTLSVWRCTGRTAIPFVKVGRNVRYPLRGLAEYLAKQTFSQTA